MNRGRIVTTPSPEINGTERRGEIFAGEGGVARSGRYCSILSANIDQIAFPIESNRAVPRNLTGLTTEP